MATHITPNLGSIPVEVAEKIVCLLETNDLLSMTTVSQNFTTSSIMIVGGVLENFLGK